MRIQIALALCLATILQTSAAQEAVGTCDAASERQKTTLEFIADSRADTKTEFVAKEPCTERTVLIKRCAVIAVQGERFQHWCRDTGKPTYYDDVETVEYWAPTQR